MAYEYTAGLSTIAELAAQHSISDYSVRVVLREGGVVPKRRSVTPEQVRQVLALWVDGDLSIEAIARGTAMSAANVRLTVTGVSRDKL